jgi:hypothetical protein
MLRRGIDGTFAVPAARRRAGWPGNCDPLIALRACLRTGFDEDALELVIKLANGLRNWTAPEFAIQKQA